MLGWRTYRLVRSLDQGLASVLDRGSRFAVLPRRHLVLSPLERKIQLVLESFEQRLAEAQREQTWFRATVQAMQEGVLVLDEQGEVLMMNPAAGRLLQVEQGIEGKTLIEVWREPAVWEMVKETLQADRRSEVEIEAAPGRRYVRVSANSVATGEKRLVLLVLRDVTAERRLEQMRRDFVANVSHELRTPLAAIQGYAETLLEGALERPDSARRFVEVIARHARQLARLAEDLLTLSNLELGRTRLELGPCESEAAVADAVEAVTALARSREVHVAVDCPSPSPTMLADPDRVQQILVNLLDNAIKYSPPGATVTVRIREVSEAAGTHLLATTPVGRWVEILVEDRGEGIPSRDLPRITERFYRVDRARSRASGGTGLGLAIVKHLLQLHGGALRIESELGHGTRVSAYLPATAAH